MEQAGIRGHQAYFHGEGVNRSFYLPRLPIAYYLADSVVHWTMGMSFRRTGWLNSEFHRHFRELMLHASARQQLYTPVYSLMPDHVHLVWMGLSPESNQFRALKFLREYLNKAIVPFKFQHQAYDHVLTQVEREQNAFSTIRHYILSNPVRANLVKKPQNWPFSGCIVPGYPGLNPLDPDYWPLFWKLYRANSSPDAGKVCRPPI